RGRLAHALDRQSQAVHLALRQLRQRRALSRPELRRASAEGRRRTQLHPLQAARGPRSRGRARAGANGRPGGTAGGGRRHDM
ncbi:MAG: hypothetical protein AVDCRST_MAG38-677, partial [uncultured Solirubrobacteraceae bacterium]